MKNLVILDLETQKKFDNSYTILWNSFSKKRGDGNFSINNLIEKKEQHYREKILNLISSFKNVSLNNKKIEDILKIDNKLSFWWFSKINEKCNETKTTELNEIVKIYALEDFIKKKKIKNIKIFSKNSNLIEYLKVYSKKNKLNLNYSVLNKKYYINFCFFINGIMAIIYSFFKYIFLTEKKLKWIKKYNLYFSYFSKKNNQLISEKFNQEIFWNKILDLENKNNLIVMIPDDNISYFDKYLLSNRINNQKKSKNYYISLYNLLDINIIIKSFILYTKHFFKVKGLFSNNFISNTNNPYLIFLKKKIFEDIAGKSLAINILHFLLIDKILKNINKPKKLIFLQENQSWEKILLYLFKTKFNTKTIGFAHSSIRFWDLRYFNSLEDIKKKNYILKKITPNITVVNSKLQKKELLKNSISKIKVGESLRHLDYQSKNNIKLKNNSKRILIIFGGLKAQDIFLINFLNNLNKIIKTKYIFVLKIHHLTDMSILNKIKFNYIIETEPLNSLKQIYKLICLGPNTSTAIDLTYLKVKFVTLLDPSSININPVKSKDFTFIKNISDFIYYLNNSNKIKTKKINFININKKLTEWKKIIK